MCEGGNARYTGWKKIIAGKGADICRLRIRRLFKGGHLAVLFQKRKYFFLLDIAVHLDFQGIRGGAVLVMRDAALDDLCLPLFHLFRQYAVEIFIIRNRKFNVVIAVDVVVNGQFVHEDLKQKQDGK